MLRPTIDEGDVSYSIDSYKFFEAPNKLLMELGKSLEKMLIMEPAEFESLFVLQPGKQSPQTPAQAEEIYRYMQVRCFFFF